MRPSVRVIVWILLSNLLLHVGSAHGEFYSATAELEELLHTEFSLLEELQHYVEALSDHVEALRSEISSIRLDHGEATANTVGYLSNPVNAFRLIKRLYSDWTTIQASVADDANRAKYLATFAAHKQNLSMPTREDFVGSAIALARLQETYKLDVAELASGMLNGVKYGSAMSWQDCFVLGQHLYASRDYNHTVPWLQESMRMLSAEAYGAEPGSLDFMEVVVDYHREMGDYENALHLINYILAIEPTRAHLHAPKRLLEQLRTDGVKLGLMHETRRPPGDYHQSHEFQLYEQVCREQLTTTVAEQRQLRCRLHHNNVGYRRLQPFKLEELHLEPYIVRIHEILGDEAMHMVQRLARPQMARSEVRAADGRLNTVAAFRTSKSAGLAYTEHPSLQRLALHIHDLTGLHMQHMEELQVANYGIGGHYEPHWDCFPEHLDYEDKELGNRIATGMYYLSDVEAGGGTAFPFLRLLVKPVRGSMLFWYNLHHSGDADYRTKHAACPVLQGSKWIANIWIRLRNQDKVRPCKLTRDNAISLIFQDFP